MLSGSAIAQLARVAIGQPDTPQGPPSADQRATELSGPAR